MERAASKILNDIHESVRSLISINEQQQKLIHDLLLAIEQFIELNKTKESN
jgi:hypothetical protein